MARATKNDKRIEKLTDTLFKKHGTNVQVSVMDLGKIFAAGRDTALAGGDDAAVEAAMVAVIARVRKN